MKKQVKNKQAIKIFLFDQEEENEVLVTSAGDALEVIENFEKREPKDKRSKAYKSWLKKLNELYKLYNEMVGFKAFHVNKY